MQKRAKYEIGTVSARTAVVLGLSLVVGCHGLKPEATPTIETENPVQAPVLHGLALQAKSPVPYKFQCALRADLSAHTDALIGRSFAITQKHLAVSSAEQAGLLGDEFLNSIVKPLRANPANADCVANEIERALDRKSVAEMIKNAAALNEAPIKLQSKKNAASFEDTLHALCGGDCVEQNGELAREFASRLSPLLAAIQQGLHVRYENVPGGAQWWRDFGGNGLLLSVDEPGYDPREASLRDVLSADRRPQYAAAAQIAKEVERLNWSEMKQWADTRFEVRTPFGWIRINGTDSDFYPANTEATLLLIDLGGDDVHLDQVASNLSGMNAVSIVIDVEGDDRYEIPAEEYALRMGDSQNAPSLSNHFAQGAARYGIAMLFDLKGDDRYESLRGSQGYAQFGVGVLFDGEGDDEYISEAASQGSAQFGIALAIDAGRGNDRRFAYTLSQGFGYVDAVGILYDDGGDDEYRCDVGHPDFDGHPLYPSPQLQDKSNVSFCQGAGYGLRAEDADLALSGGIGILRDASGDDLYEASVYAQGSAYWQGTGMLLDGAGHDSFDALYYAQGVGVHFAHGILIDRGNGNDLFDTKLPNRGLSLGAGHDYGIGVHINEAGNDKYVVEKYSAGGTSCNGRGLFLEFGGDDSYEIKSIHSLGVGNAGECAQTRIDVPSIGVMIDADGNDDYYSDGHHAGNDRAWNLSSNALTSEIGIGLDSSEQDETAQWRSAPSRSCTQ
jgi:hypothetical protein